jgi:Domain of unknown function (DUF4249)
MKRLIYISLVLLALSSCEVDVTDEFRNQQPLFVVSGQFIAGEVPRINLSKTITMTTLDSLMLLDNAQVEIGLGDQIYVLGGEGKGCYRNEHLVPEPGDQLMLNCSGEGLPNVSMVSQVPEKPLVKGMDFQVDENYGFNLDLHFEDPDSTEDYYEFYLSGWRKQVSRHYYNGELLSVDTNMVYQSYGVQMLDPVMEYEGGYGNYEAFDLDMAHGSQFIFSDSQINGMDHTISVRSNLLWTYNDSIPELYVHLVKKDVHFYNFISTYMHYDPYPDQDFLQPVQVYSNIENGFGLLTAESRVVDTIDLSQWYYDPDFLELVKDPEE